MNSPASERKTTTNGNAETDDDFGIGIAEGDYDEMLGFQEFQTTFEKKIAPHKRARIIGVATRSGRIRGAFGNMGGCSSTKPNFFSTAKKTIRSNNDILFQQENRMNHNLEEITNPPSLESNVFCEFNDNDDEDGYNVESLKNLPSDLYSNRNHRFGKPMHQRSASMTIQNRSPLRLVRSNSSIPRRQKTMPRIQRSHSIAAGQGNERSVFWGGSFDIDLLDSMEPMGELSKKPENKKWRERRHSLSMIPLPDTVQMRNTTTTTTISSSSLSSSTLLNDRAISCHELELDDFQSSEPTISVFSQTSAMSPEESSVVSTSRKRDASGSSISDLDEYLTLSGSSLSGKRRSCSELRVFSPPSRQNLPMAPFLDRDRGYDGSSTDRHSSYVTNQHKPNELRGHVSGRGGGRSDAMDQDSEDETSERHSSPDSSFEDVGSSATITMTTTTSFVAEDQDSKVKRILDTMPSIDDLKFLLSELQSEDRRCRRFIVGSGDTWKVAPPINSWTSQRRTAFIHWAKTSLGFTVRSAGMGYMFVQINKKRGAHLSDTLHVALIKCLTSEQPSTLGVSNLDESQLLFSHGTSMRSDAAQDTSCNNSVVPLFPPPSSYNFMSSHMEDLADKVNALSMNESKSSSIVGSSPSQSQPVTLPTPLHDDIHICIGGVRLSVESREVGPKISRPSIDSHSNSGELTHHLYGHSPRMSFGRPPKMSTFNGFVSENSNSFGGVRSSTTPSTDNLCFVTTPLMSQDRGWGSRPLDGRDWGASASCSNSVLRELMLRFEHALEMEAVSRVSNSQYTMPSQRLSQLDFDLEADCEDSQKSLDAKNIDRFLLEKENQRKHRKMISNFNKKKRVSLFAPSVSTQLLLPTRLSRCPASLIDITVIKENKEKISVMTKALQTEAVILNALSYLNETELMMKASVMCKAWSDCATIAHSNLLVASVQGIGNDCVVLSKPMLERSWNFLHLRFPWACFLAEGGAKKVYKVYNSSVHQEEALSVMDTHNIDNIQIVANELAVSAMVSSLVRRGVCPNFIVMHGVFTCSYAPPESLWGNEETRKPRGKRFDKKNVPIQVTTPKGGEQGRFQYIRMELANEGDAEELIKRQNNEIFSPYVARSIFFQVAFSLFAAAEKFSIKHYDVKLLNIFVQNTHSVSDLVLRYGLGSHIFALRMPSSHPYIVKLADFGTANMMPTSTGLPITIAHFTTLENTPPDFMILGDAAKQGHGHDNFGLGLIMLHLFMGSRPYEEVLEDVKCPSNLKANLRSVWEDEEVHGYSIIRSLIFDGVDVDEYGNVEGVLDETLYDTLYRFLVLFGIPKVKFQEKLGRLVWNAIFDALSPSYHVASSARIVKKRSRKKANDVTTFKRDCKKFSIRTGNNLYISRARSALTALPGGIELLFCLCNFDPTIRASAMDVLNSTLMEDLRENPDADVDQYYDESTTVNSYMDFATITPQVN